MRLRGGSLGGSLGGSRPGMVVPGTKERGGFSIVALWDGGFRIIVIDAAAMRGEGSYSRAQCVRSRGFLF